MLGMRGTGGGVLLARLVGRPSPASLGPGMPDGGWPSSMMPTDERRGGRRGGGASGMPLMLLMEPPGVWERAVGVWLRTPTRDCGRLLLVLALPLALLITGPVAVGEARSRATPMDRRRLGMSDGLAAPERTPTVDEARTWPRLGGRVVEAVSMGRWRGAVGGTKVEAESPCRAFMLSELRWRALVSRTSGDGIDGRVGRVLLRVVGGRLVLRSRGEVGVCGCLSDVGGVSSASERRTHEEGESMPTDLSSRIVTVAVDEVSEELPAEVTVAVEAVRADIARLAARPREAVRKRIVDMERPE